MLLKEKGQMKVGTQIRVHFWVTNYIEKQQTWAGEREKRERVFNGSRVSAGEGEKVLRWMAVRAAQWHCPLKMVRCMLHVFTTTKGKQTNKQTKRTQPVYAEKDMK